MNKYILNFVEIIISFIKSIIFSSLYKKCVFFQYVLIIFLIILILGQKFSEETKGGKTGYIPSMHPFAVLTYIFLFLFIINSLFLNLAYKKEYLKYRIADVQIQETKNLNENIEDEFETVEIEGLENIKQQQTEKENQENLNDQEIDKELLNELNEDEDNKNDKLFENVNSDCEIK